MRAAIAACETRIFAIVVLSPWQTKKNGRGAGLDFRKKKSL
jgi:hypothetical protein